MACGLNLAGELWPWSPRPAKFSQAPCGGPGWTATPSPVGSGHNPSPPLLDLSQVMPPSLSMRPDQALFSCETVLGLASSLPPSVQPGGACCAHPGAELRTNNS